MESQLSLHLKNFNNRVKVMNQTNAKDLTLTAADARNIHADIFELLTQIQSLTEIRNQEDAKDNAAVTVEFDGGNF